jgi:F0F1-type ATP synthase assembly protein I
MGPTWTKLGTPILMTMAQAPGSKKTPKQKLSRAEKKAGRQGRWQTRRETFSSMKQAFTLTRQNDSRLIPYLIIAFVLGALVGFLIPYLTSGNIWISIVPALLIGLFAALFVFSRRAQSSAYSQAEGQPGAAAYVLGQMRGDWRKTDAVAGTTQLDAVHRLLGRPGVVLVGEGAPHRVRPLLAQEKKRVSRLAGDAPIYDIVVGNGDGEIPLGKLNTHITKLPRNLSKEQVVALDRRLSALNTQRTPIPQGPMPGGAKMRSVQRAARRRG